MDRTTLFYRIKQGLRSRNFFFRFGSRSVFDFQKVSAPAPALAPEPAPAPATALELPVFTDFYVKKDIFHVFNERKST